MFDAELTGKMGIIIQGDYSSAHIISQLLESEGCDTSLFLHHEKITILQQLEKQTSLDFLIINTKCFDLIPSFIAKFPRLAVILVTTEDKENVRPDSRVKKVIPKPFNIEKFCAEIATVFKQNLTHYPPYFP